MRKKRWLVIGAMLAGALAAGLGTAGISSDADEPVRVYLVHGAQAPAHGSSRWGTSDGITTYSAGGQGNVWATQALGYLEDVDEHWVVLRKAEGRQEIHIPRERVQLIEHVSEDYLKHLLGGK